VVGRAFLIFFAGNLAVKVFSVLSQKKGKREKNPVLFWSLQVHFEEVVNGHQPSWPGQNLSFINPWSQHEE
jgi:hypothetical protein